MRTLVDIDKDISICKLKLVSSKDENKRALEKRIEQLEWERTCTTAERERK